MTSPGLLNTNGCTCTGRGVGLGGMGGVGGGDGEPTLLDRSPEHHLVQLHKKAAQVKVS